MARLGSLAFIGSLLAIQPLYSDEPTHLPLRTSVTTGYTLPALPNPARTLHLSPSGQDTADGTKSAPFLTLEKCRDAIRQIRQKSGLPAGGIRVVIEAGTYFVQNTIEFTKDDSGTAAAPITYVADSGQKPIFTGGKAVTEWRHLTKDDGYPLLPTTARERVWVADLAACGIDSLLPLKLGGFASSTGFSTHPTNELFCNGRPMLIARGPNAGFVLAKKGPGQGTLTYTGDLPAKWVHEPDLLLYGYWKWGWADSYEKPLSILPDQHLITFSQPFPQYGFGDHAQFCVINALSELDEPGEYYLDRENKKVLFYPPASFDPKQSNTELTILGVPMVACNGTSFIRFEGITWKMGGSDALVFTNTNHMTVAGCTVSGFSGGGIEFTDAHDDTVISCDIDFMGRGGVAFTGGDRKNLTPANDRLENCDIHDLSRIDHTYTPGILASGVGMIVSHNRFYNILSSAMRIEGNDQLVQYNEVYNVALESDDQGGSDTWGDPTYRGILFQFNYWHHIGDWRSIPPLPSVGHAGIRLDDAISGTHIFGNIFERCSDAHFGGVQMNGGKENVVENNLFIDCAKCVSIGKWSADRWKELADKKLKELGLNWDIYCQRYPELKSLMDYPVLNQVHNNATLRCPIFLEGRGEEKQAATGNDALLPAPFTVTTAPASVEIPGLKPIPLGEIGIYKDAWRTSEPD